MSPHPLVVGCAAAAGASLALTPAVIALARARGWMAQPRADRWSQRPTALMGGIAIYGATILGAALAGGVHRGTWVLWAAASAIFLLGLIDDRYHLRPHIKVVGQVAAACFLIANGIHLSTLPLLWSLPLTVFWMIGITNAINLLDNMDGLAAGVAAIAALVISAYGLLMGDAGVAQFALPLAAACLGFLVFNFQPARIFMGDCGSMFIGFALGGIAIVGTRRTAPNLLLPLLIPVAALAVPIFDTTLVTVARRLAGRPVSEGGRDHSSHRLVALGLSERGAVLVFYLLSLLFGGLAIWAIRLPLLVTSAIALLLFIALVGTGVFLGTIQLHPTSGAAPGGTLLGGHLQYGKQIAQVLVDLLLIPVACVGAYLLRFDGQIPPDLLAGIARTLPFLMAIKIIALAMSRGYRGVWRCAGMADVLAVVRGSTLGSLVSVLLIGGMTTFAGISRGTFFIDWLLFTNLAIAARTGLTMLRYLFASMPRRDAPRVLVIGATPVGLAAAETLSDPRSLQPACVAGFLDEDPANQQRALNGHPVLGTVDDLPAVIEEEHASCCVLALAPGTEQAERALLMCELCYIEYRWAAEVLFAPAALPQPATPPRPAAPVPQPISRSARAA